MNISKRQKIEAVAMNRIVNYTAVIFIIFTAALYMYFANSTVRTLTVLEKTKQNMQSLSVKISEMESKRLLSENKVNIETAKQLGFVEVSNPNFIMKNSQKTALSLKTD